MERHSGVNRCSACKKKKKKKKKRKKDNKRNKNKYGYLLILEKGLYNHVFSPSFQRISSRYSDWLRAGRSGDRIPVGARVFSHVQTYPEAHPASCTMGSESFLRVKRPRRVADHRPLLAPRSR
jgi:hypothetical protein